MGKDSQGPRKSGKVARMPATKFPKIQKKLRKNFVAAQVQKRKP